jgi:hypothetical protein
MLTVIRFLITNLLALANNKSPTSTSQASTKPSSTLTSMSTSPSTTVTLASSAENAAKRMRDFDGRVKSEAAELAEGISLSFSFLSLFLLPSFIVIIISNIINNNINIIITNTIIISLPQLIFPKFFPRSHMHLQLETTQA